MPEWLAIAAAACGGVGFVFVSSYAAYCAVLRSPEAVTKHKGFMRVCLVLFPLFVFFVLLIRHLVMLVQENVEEDWWLVLVSPLLVAAVLGVSYLALICVEKRRSGR